MFGPVGVLLLTFLAAEIVVSVVVARLIGVLPLLLLMLVSGLIGTRVVRRQGARMMSNTLGSVAANGRLDSGNIVDGTANLFAGVLLVVPGLVSSGLGALLLLPPVHRLIRPLAFARASRWTGFTKRFGSDVIDVTVVDDRPKPSQSAQRELDRPRSTDER